MTNLEWLMQNKNLLRPEAKHNPLYKKGDIILTNYGTLAFVIREVGNMVDICNNEKEIDRIGIVIYMNKEDIKKKIGNIYD